MNIPSDLIGLTSFDQYEDTGTDTVIYTFSKLVNLLLNCNPNTIEILGLDDDQYVIRSETGQELLDHRQIFLSKRAAASFGHYADAQLRRPQNAIARDTLSQPSREEHILKSVGHALDDFNRRQAEQYKTDAKLYIDTAETEGFETEIFLDADFQHYPLRRYNDMMNTLHTVVRDYDKIGKRNHKKDDNHLNKHAMHLVRLFMMGIDILEKGEIRTHRPETDLVLTSELYEAIRELLARKAEAEEKDLNPQMPVIINFIREDCARQKQISDAAVDDHRHDYGELNDAFRKLLADRG